MASPEPKSALFLYLGHQHQGQVEPDDGYEENKEQQSLSSRLTPQAGAFVADQHMLLIDPSLRSSSSVKNATGNVADPPYLLQEHSPSSISPLTLSSTCSSPSPSPVTPTSPLLKPSPALATPTPQVHQHTRASVVPIAVATPNPTSPTSSETFARSFECPLPRPPPKASPTQNRSPSSQVRRPSPLRQTSSPSPTGTPTSPTEAMSVPSSAGMSWSPSAGSVSSMASSSSGGDLPRPILRHHHSHSTVRTSSPLRQQVGFDDASKGPAVPRSSWANDAPRSRRGRTGSKLAWSQTVHGGFGEFEHGRPGPSSGGRPSTFHDRQPSIDCGPRMMNTPRPTGSLNTRAMPGNRPASTPLQGLWNDNLDDVELPPNHPSTAMPGFPSVEFADSIAPKFSRAGLRKGGIVMPVAAGRPRSRVSHDGPRPRSTVVADNPPKAVPEASAESKPSGGLSAMVRKFSRRAASSPALRDKAKQQAQQTTQQKQASGTPPVASGTVRHQRAPQPLRKAASNDHMGSMHMNRRPPTAWPSNMPPPGRPATQVFPSQPASPLSPQYAAPVSHHRATPMAPLPSQHAPPMSHQRAPSMPMPVIATQHAPPMSHHRAPSAPMPAMPPQSRHHVSPGSPQHIPPGANRVSLGPRSPPPPASVYRQLPPGFGTPIDFPRPPQPAHPGVFSNQPPSPAEPMRSFPPNAYPGMQMRAVPQMQPVPAGVAARPPRDSTQDAARPHLRHHRSAPGLRPVSLEPLAEVGPSSPPLPSPQVPPGSSYNPPQTFGPLPHPPLSPTTLNRPARIPSFDEYPPYAGVGLGLRTPEALNEEDEAEDEDLEKSGPDIWPVKKIPDFSPVLSLPELSSLSLPSFDRFGLESKVSLLLAGDNADQFTLPDLPGAPSATAQTVERPNTPKQRRASEASASLLQAPPTHPARCVSAFDPESLMAPVGQKLSFSAPPTPNLPSHIPLLPSIPMVPVAEVATPESKQVQPPPRGASLNAISATTPRATTPMFATVAAARTINRSRSPSSLSLCSDASQQSTASSQRSISSLTSASSAASVDMPDPIAEDEADVESNIKVVASNPSSVESHGNVRDTIVSSRLSVATVDTAVIKNVTRAQTAVAMRLPVQ